MALWLMRHPKVLLPQPVCYGTSAVPVDVAHVQECAQRIVQRWPQGVEMVCSALPRTQVLARQVLALAAKSNSSSPACFSWRVDARLNEMDFGHWEGVPWQQIPKAAVDAWVGQFPQHRFGGAECVQEVIDRVCACLQEYRQQACQPKNTESTAESTTESARDVLWITHAGVIRAVRFVLQNPSARIQRASQWPVQTLAFGQMWRLEELEELEDFGQG